MNIHWIWVYTFHLGISVRSFLFFSLLCCSSRKRRPSYTHDGDMYMGGFRDDEQMDECNAALVLMSLSGSPHSPRPWILGSSPASNSSGSWTSCSEELSDEGVAAGSLQHHPHHRRVADAMHSPQSTPSNSAKSAQYIFNTQPNTNRLRTASLSTSDEGIVMDYNDETPRKRRVCTHIDTHTEFYATIKILNYFRNTKHFPKKKKIKQNEFKYAGMQFFFGRIFTNKIRHN